MTPRKRAVTKIQWQESFSQNTYNSTTSYCLLLLQHTVFQSPHWKKKKRQHPTDVTSLSKKAKELTSHSANTEHS